MFLLSRIYYFVWSTFIHRIGIELDCVLFNLLWAPDLKSLIWNVCRHNAIWTHMSLEELALLSVMCRLDNLIKNWMSLLIDLIIQPQTLWWGRWQPTKTSSSLHGLVIGLKAGTHWWASWMAWSFRACLILAFKERRGIIVCWCHWSHPFYSRSLRHNNQKLGVAESLYQGMIDTGWWLFQICMSSHLV